MFKNENNIDFPPYLLVSLLMFGWRVHGLSLIRIDTNRRCNYIEKNRERERERESCPLPNCMVGFTVRHCPRGLTPNRKTLGSVLLGRAQSHWRQVNQMI